MPIKVLVVDDSALIRSLLSAVIDQAPDLILVGSASNAYIAKEMVIRYSPDVITLDIEMPEVNGLTFLDRLMKARPTPVIMISTLTEQGADATLRSLELGAIDFIAKSKLNIVNGKIEYQQEIVDKIRAAAHVSLKKPIKRVSELKILPLQYVDSKTVVGIGASTGGTEAIRLILQQLPSNFPAIIITQHMPPNFTHSFAQRLNATCKINVHEACDGERILPGTAYIAPGDKHLEIVKKGVIYLVQLNDGPIVSGHKPAVDVMFESLAKAVGINAVAAVLTGMGKDGANGLLSLFQLGAITIAQDEESSIVYGMPRAAVEIGATKQIIPLEKMSQALIDAAEQKNRFRRL